MDAQPFEVIPAIDLLDGEAVRLFKGDYAQKTVYSTRPEELAGSFAAAGARWLHLVDLNGAKEAKPVNTASIQRIRQATSLKIELGGGIRGIDTVKLYLDDLGVDRVILGTAALEDPDFLETALSAYGPERIVAGVDVKEGFVSTSGWLHSSHKPYAEFVEELEAVGVAYVVATDISKDGTLMGPHWGLYEDIAAVSGLKIVVSGGVHDDKDVLEAQARGYYACIVGKAYYEGAVDLPSLIRATGKEKRDAH
jgi:phosphoribosylformimino-5-aminoimidazole carboxamide ribotide isomerase